MDGTDISELSGKTSFLTADLDAGMDMDALTERFSALTPGGLTVISPSRSNPVCRYVAEKMASNLDGAELMLSPVLWVTPEEVGDMALDFGSEFRKEYRAKFNEAYSSLCAYLNRMEDSSDDIFDRYVRSRLTDVRMRKAVDRTLKKSFRTAGKINGRNVILVVDAPGNEHIDIDRSFAPASLTVLTLTSKVFNADFTAAPQTASGVLPDIEGREIHD